MRKSKHMREVFIGFNQVKRIQGFRITLLHGLNTIVKFETLVTSIE